MHRTVYATGNTDKVRQVQSIHQQIMHFVNNPTFEALANAKHFRDMLERLQVGFIGRSLPPRVHHTDVDSSAARESNELANQSIHPVSEGNE